MLFHLRDEPPDLIIIDAVRPVFEESEEVLLMSLALLWSLLIILCILLQEDFAELKK